MKAIICMERERGLVKSNILIKVYIEAGSRWTKKKEKAKNFTQMAISTMENTKMENGTELANSSAKMDSPTEASSSKVSAMAEELPYTSNQEHRTRASSAKI